MDDRLIIEIAGEVGIGKTTLALNAPLSDPSKLHVFNFDTKPISGSGAFGSYREYAHMLSHDDHKHKYARMAEQFLIDLQNLVEKGDQSDIIVLDHFDLVSDSLYALLTQKPVIAGRHWFGKNDFWLSMERWTARKVLEQGFLSALLTKTKVLAIVNHIKDEYDDDNNKTGYKIVDTSGAVKQVASIRVWLVPETGCASPSALVLKNPASHVFDKKKGRFVTAKVLPQRITAKPDIGYSLWDSILEYFESPAGLRELRPDEKFTEGDRELVRAEINLGILPEVVGLEQYVLEQIDKPFAILRVSVKKQFGVDITQDMYDTLKG